MDFIDKIQNLSKRVPLQLEYCLTEEATKTALIMPFISALGYDVFDPTEVVPEYVSDIGTKKGEKADYAIMIDGNPVILFECKWSGADLNKELRPNYIVTSMLSKVRDLECYRMGWSIASSLI